MTTVKFSSREEALNYISGDKIECLECGKMFALLEKHLRIAHTMTCNEYRDKYNIPVSIPLAGASYREKHRQKMNKLQQSGAIDYAHLSDASKAAKTTGRGQRRDFDLQHQAEMMKEINESGLAYRRKKKAPSY